MGRFHPAFNTVEDLHVEAVDNSILYDQVGVASPRARRGGWIRGV